jgi:hypothetical protein
MAQTASATPATARNVRLNRVNYAAPFGVAANHGAKSGDNITKMAGGVKDCRIRRRSSDEGSRTRRRCIERYRITEGSLEGG